MQFSLTLSVTVRHMVTVIRLSKHKIKWSSYSKYLKSYFPSKLSLFLILQTARANIIYKKIGNIHLHVCNFDITFYTQYALDDFFFQLLTKLCFRNIRIVIIHVRWGMRKTVVKNRGCPDTYLILGRFPILIKFPYTAKDKNMVYLTWLDSS